VATSHLAGSLCVKVPLRFWLSAQPPHMLRVYSVYLSAVHLFADRRTEQFIKRHEAFQERPEAVCLPCLPPVMSAAGGRGEFLKGFLPLVSI
jgi:hypothetical protein